MANASANLFELSDATLATLPERAKKAAVPAYDRSRLRAGIAHIGVGNFHRVHGAVYVDRCLHLPDHDQWAICGIGLGDGAGAKTKAEAFRKQDCLYSVIEFDADGSSKSQVIGAMIDYLHVPGDPEAAVRRLADPEIRIVSLTITEGGYNLDEATGEFMLDTPEVAGDIAGAPPRTAFGLIVAALRRRKAAGHPAFTVLSCDNLRQNGDTARRAVLAFANAVDASLATWIKTEVAFPNSMVDRIAPQVSATDLGSLNQLTGFKDAIPAIGETYAQWVLEDRFSAGRPDFAAAGVELRGDVDTYESMKGRMLNASHMLLSYPAILCGYRLVPDAMRDPLLVSLLRQFMERDVIPVLSGPDGVSLAAYKEKIIERFANPAVADQLLRVAHDGAAKIPVFHSKTIQMLKDGRRSAQCEAFLLACFAKYLAGVDELGACFEVKEPHLSEADWALLRSDDPLAVLKMNPFVALSLDTDEAFVKQYAEVSRSIASNGVKQTLALLVSLSA